MRDIENRKQPIFVSFVVITSQYKMETANKKKKLKSIFFLVSLCSYWNWNIGSVCISWCDAEKKTLYSMYPFFHCSLVGFFFIISCLLLSYCLYWSLFLVFIVLFSISLHTKCIKTHLKFYGRLLEYIIRYCACLRCKFYYLNSS